MKKFLLIFFSIILNACGNSALPPAPMTAAQQNDAMLEDAKKQIQTGDIVLRCGKDITSYKIREMSETDKTYSHAGLAIVRSGGIYIYHLSPPELDEPKDDTLIRVEPLDKFANPESNFEFGIARFPFSSDQVQQLITHLEDLRKEKVSFDFHFDLTTKNKMYCSEMIDDCIRRVTHDSLFLKRNKLRDPRLVKKAVGYLKADTSVVRSRLYIPIENIYLHPACKIIGRYKFVRDVN
jgi:hypothetical protein